MFLDVGISCRIFIHSYTERKRILEKDKERGEVGGALHSDFGTDFYQ